MQRHINANQQIGEITELEFINCGNQENNKYKSQCIFQQPIVQVGGSCKSADPYDQKYGTKNP